MHIFSHRHDNLPSTFHLYNHCHHFAPSACAAYKSTDAITKKLAAAFGKHIPPDIVEALVLLAPIEGITVVALVVVLVVVAAVTTNIPKISPKVGLTCAPTPILNIK